MYVALQEPCHVEKKRSFLTFAIILAFFHVFIGIFYGIYWAKFSLVDSVYFTISTVLLIGYGDIHFLHDNFSLIFGTVYILTGIFVTSFLTGAVLRVSVDRWNAETQKEIARQIMNLSQSHYSPVQIAFHSLTRRFIFTVLFFSGLMLVCSVMLAFIEDWKFLEAAYFLAVSWSSLGTGDYVTQTKNGKIVAAVVLPIGLLTTAAVFSSLASLPFYVEKAEEEHVLIKEYGTALTVKSVDVIAKTKELQILGFQSNPEVVTRNEFILWLLLKLGKIDISDIKHLGKAFDLIDFTGDGRLGLADIEHIKRSSIEGDEYHRVRRLQSTLELGSVERQRRASMHSGSIRR